MFKVIEHTFRVIRDQSLIEIKNESRNSRTKHEIEPLLSAVCCLRIADTLVETIEGHGPRAFRVG